ncbi:Zinc finger, RING-type [Dillenia turbinata]|uniref:Zinc finger, RING-type n=1 Tax=Dillenia turbinata TaxID=194707 RepID=A0AAN8VK65_9MAGN
MDDKNRPNPSLVPVPVQFLKESVKDCLVVKEFGCLDPKLVGKDAESEETVCGVCLNCIDAEDKVGELGNCRHLFHRECLDAWIDRGWLTCPYCRTKLFSEEVGSSSGDQKDPWRKERMIYLFGEDYVF